MYFLLDFTYSPAYHIQQFKGVELETRMVKKEEILLNVLKSYKDYNPPDGEEQFLREVFDTTSEDLVTVCKPVPYYKRLIIQKAIFSVLHDWEIKEV